LCGILVLSGGIDNQLDPIVGDVGLEIGSRSPRVGTSVRNLLNNGVKRNDIGRRAAKEDESDSSFSSRLHNSISKCANIPESIRVLKTYIPGDGIRSANWDNLVESRLINWVSLWVSNWSGERVCERSKGSSQGSEKSVLHFEEKKKNPE